MVDYRKLRFNNLNSPQFRHLLMLLWWPLYGVLFYTLEKVPALAQFSFFGEYKDVYCRWDAEIPFCEWFFIPYLFWFVLIVAMHGYTLFFDIPAFKKMMKFFMITYTSTLVIYFLFPTEQNLRSEIVSVGRDNILIDWINSFYQFDTNTNVCPSLHVIGTWASVYGAFQCKPFRKPTWVVILTVIGISICMSTVFLNQHSIIDVFVAIPLCVAATFLSGWEPLKKRKAKLQAQQAKLQAQQ